MYGTLSKLLSTNDNLRTDEVEGEFNKIPTVGGRFEMVGEPLDKEKDVRFVSTSIIQKVSTLSDDEFDFTTMYSVYNLKVYRKPL